MAEKAFRLCYWQTFLGEFMQFHIQVNLNRFHKLFVIWRLNIIIILVRVKTIFSCFQTNDNNRNQSCVCDKGNFDFKPTVRSDNSIFSKNIFDLILENRVFLKKVKFGFFFSI